MSSHRRRGTHGGLLFTSGPWLRAPLLLLRRPSVFLAILVSTAVLAIAASSGVLYVSTLGTASLRVQAAGDCPERSMPTFSAAVRDDGHSVRSENAAGVRAMKRSGLPGTPYTVDIVGDRIQASPVTFFARRGALAHVHTVTASHGQPGVWFPAVFAHKLRVHPGDHVRTVGGAHVTVAGIYKDLSADPFHIAALPRYWCNWSQLITQVTSGNIGTPPFLISDEASVDAVAAGTLGQSPSGSGHDVNISWFVPLPHRATTATARTELHQAAHARVHYLNTSDRAVTGLNPQADSVVAAGDTGIPRDDPLLKKLHIASTVRNGLAGSVVPIDLAGAIIALLLVAGAGGFWAAHRSREISLLHSRGAGPGALATKAVLETAPAAVIGLAAGFAATVALVRGVGPADVFTPGTVGRGLGAAVGATVLALAIIALFGAFARRDRAEAQRGARLRRVLAMIPYELALIGFAGWAWEEITNGSGIGFHHAVVDVHPLLLLFPILGVAGAVLLAGRLIALAVPVLGRKARGLPSAAYLAMRRIGGSRAIAVGLVIGTALPCGLLAYAGTVSTGVHQELVRKYKTNLGAPVVLNLVGVRAATPDLHGHGTAVVTYERGPKLGDGTQAAVLGVDPATFAKFAYTNGAQRHAVAELRASGSAGRHPAVLVQAASGTQAGSVHFASTTLRLNVVSHLDVFPGLRTSYYPMVVVSRDALRHIDPNVPSVSRLTRGNEAWTTPGQVTAATRAIQAGGFSILDQLDPAIRVGNSGLLPLTWIFSYLRALAILIGAVAITALIFALSARTRRRVVSYVMSKRMGMSPGTHLRSLLIELGGIVGLGWIVGTGVGLAGYAALSGSLDLKPSLPPGAAFTVSTITLAVTLAVVVVVIILAALGTQLSAERAQPAEILRLE